MRYVTLRKDGQLDVIYPTEVYGDKLLADGTQNPKIPQTAVPITDAEWDLQYQNKPQMWNGTAWVDFIYVPVLADAQTAALAKVEGQYTDLISASTVTINGNTFQADAGSQELLNNTLTALAGSAPPIGFYWLDATNNKVFMTTNAELQSLAKAMLIQGFPDFNRLQTAKSKIRAATSVSDVQLVKF